MANYFVNLEFDTSVGDDSKQLNPHIVDLYFQINWINMRELDNSFPSVVNKLL